MSVVLLCAILGAQDLPPIVDRILAVVDGEVITHSDLVVEARVALVMRRGEKAALGKLDPEFLATFGDYLINQVLVAAVVRRLGNPSISDAAVDAQTREFANRFRSYNAYRAFMRRFGISKEQLRSILRRDLENERYIASRVQAQLVPGASERATQEQTKEAVDRWLKELRQGVEIRLLAPDGELRVQ